MKDTQCKCICEVNKGNYPGIKKTFDINIVIVSFRIETQTTVSVQILEIFI